MSYVNALATGNFDGKRKRSVAGGEVGVFAVRAGRDGGVRAVRGGRFVEVEGIGVCVDGGEVDGRA